MIDTLTATDDARSLTVGWDTGCTSTLPATLLRQEARDAWSIRQRLDHGEIAVQPNLTITKLIQVGAAGVNVHFSDGHERAIYPFSYLQELSQRFDN